jgi:hypothetical protein
VECPPDHRGDFGSHVADLNAPANADAGTS